MLDSTSKDNVNASLNVLGRFASGSFANPRCSLPRLSPAPGRARSWSPWRRASSADKAGVVGEDCRTSLPFPWAEPCRVDYVDKHSKSAFTAVIADAPGSPRPTWVGLAMTAEARLHDAEWGEKAVPDPALPAGLHQLTRW